MIGTPRKGALYPVLLDCGHDRLVTGACYFSGSAVCHRCTTTHVKVRWIERAYTLRNVHCLRLRR